MDAHKERLNMEDKREAYNHHYWVDYFYIALIVGITVLGGVIAFWEDITDFFE
jgi:hypothetical protein